MNLYILQLFVLLMQAYGKLLSMEIQNVLPAQNSTGVTPCSVKEGVYKGKNYMFIKNKTLGSVNENYRSQIRTPTKCK